MPWPAPRVTVTRPLQAGEVAARVVATRQLGAVAAAVAHRQHAVPQIDAPAQVDDVAPGRQRDPAERDVVAVAAAAPVVVAHAAGRAGRDRRPGRRAEVPVGARDRGDGTVEPGATRVTVTGLGFEPDAPARRDGDQTEGGSNQVCADPPDRIVTQLGSAIHIAPHKRAHSASRHGVMCVRRAHADRRSSLGGLGGPYASTNLTASGHDPRPWRSHRGAD